MKYAILYAAKSTADKNASIPTQLRQGRELAEADSFSVAGEYKDENKSAFTGDRGDELVKAKAHAEQLVGEGHEVTLIVQHSDRLARGDGVQAAHLVEYALWAIKSGVKIVSKQDAHTFADLLYAVVTGQRNHEDSARKSQATKDGIERRAVERGLAVGGRRRFGYRWADDRSGMLIPVPHEAEVVDLRMYRATLAGVSGLQIARELEADGVKTVKGGRWHAGTISQILRNPLYKGMVRHQGEVYPGKHEPIVDPEIWDAVAALLSSRRKSKGKGRGRPPATGHHLFRKGMLRCICGGAMVTRTDRRTLADGSEAMYEYYECYNHHCDPASCPVTKLRREAVDPKVYAYFERVGVDVEATRAEMETAQTAHVSEVRALRGQADQEAQKAREGLERVKRDYIDGRIDAENWNDIRGDLTGGLEAAEAQVARFDQQLADVEAGGATRDLEAEVVEKLTAIRAAVAGEVQDAEGVDAARAALQRLFEGFTLRHPALGQRVPAELAWSGPDDFVLEPTLREGVIPSPEPLYSAKNNFNVAVVT
ncbi:MAG TPA: recombinase family protein [Solirubrobacterales bacterium]